MAYIPGVVLLASAARTASGTGDSVDLKARLTVTPRLEVTAVSGTSPTLVVVLETSKTGNTWTTLDTFLAVSASSLTDRSAVSAERYLRARWTIGGLSPSFTFAVTVDGEQFYVTADDLKAELSEQTFTQIYDDDNDGLADAVAVEEDIREAQSITDGYVRGIYALPIADPVPRILRTCTKHLAAAFAERRHPEYARSDGADKYRNAIEILKQIGLRNVRLDIAAEPIAAPNEVFVVVTNLRRGWGGIV